MIESCVSCEIILNKCQKIYEGSERIPGGSDITGQDDGRGGMEYTEHEKRSSKKNNKKNSNNNNSNNNNNDNNNRKT